MNTPGFQIQLFTPRPEASISWRLLSGNNREAGRGAYPASDVDACLQAVTQLQERIAGMQPRVRRVDPGGWSWEILSDGRVEVYASHRFDRLIRCEQAVVQFVAEFAVAPIRAGLVISGARRWSRAS